LSDNRPTVLLESSKIYRPNSFVWKKKNLTWSPQKKTFQDGGGGIHLQVNKNDENCSYATDHFFVTSQGFSKKDPSVWLDELVQP